MIDKDGYIYIVSNPAMPGGLFTRKRFLKIGMTMDIRSRLRGLSNTSVPLPFVVEHLLFVPDRFAYESVIHQQLDKYRVSDDREYFYLSPKKAISLIHGKRSKVFEIVENNETDAIYNASIRSDSVMNGGRPRLVREAKAREPVSDRLDREDQAFFEKISADIKSGTLKEFTNVLVRQNYGVGDARLKRARKHLLDMGLLTQSGNKYIVAATATEI